MNGPRMMKTTSDENQLPMDANWAVVAASFFCNFVSLGIIYSFGIYFLPIALSFGLGYGTTSFAGSVVVASMLATAGLIGKLTDKIDLRVIILCGALVAPLMLFLSTYSTNIYQLIACYVFVGTGLAATGPHSVTAVQHWFREKRGIATGIAMAGSGLGNFMFAILFQQLLDSYTDGDGDGWKLTMRWEALVAVLILLPTCVFMEQRGRFAGTPRKPPLYSWWAHPRRDVGGIPSSETNPSGAGPALLPASSNIFKFILACKFVGSFGYLNAFIHIVPFARTLGISQDASSWLLSTLGISATFGRIIMGYAADKHGILKTFRVNLVIMMVASAWWIIVALRVFSQDGNVNFWLLLVFSILYGSSAGGFVSLPPSLIAEYFGSSAMGNLIGMQFAADMPGNLFGPPICGLLFDLSTNYVLPGVFTCVALALSLLITCWIPTQLEQRNISVIEDDVL